MDENNPLSYDAICRVCQFQKIKLDSAKNTIKCLTESLRKYQKNEAEKDNTIEDFKHSIEKIEEELAKCIEERNTLKNEGKKMKLSLLENQRKYIELEISYDQNLALSQNEIKAELFQKTVKVAKLEEQIKRLQQSFEQEKSTIKRLYEERISAQMLELEALRVENSRKDEQLLKMQVEDAKNNEMRELNGKLVAKERVMQQQHIQRVQPLITVPSTSRECNIAPNVSYNSITTTGDSSSQSNILVRRSERVIANVVPTVSQISPQILRNHYIFMYNELESSDSDSDMDFINN